MQEVQNLMEKVKTLQRDLDLEYVERLLKLCTDSQRDLFNRMYPKGLKEDAIPHATHQIEQTLKSQTVNTETARKEVEELQMAISNLNIENARLKQQVKDLTDVEVKVKLVRDNDLLNALIAEGVDNWGGYGYALDRLKEDE